jgi:3-oxoadipate enol-lactonase
MSFVRLNGGVVHYRDEGLREGRALVFINALGSDLRIWDDVARILSPDFRLIRYDNRGHGLSESGPDRYDIADYACDLGALLDELTVDRATIVGLSVGGLIAQELYRQRPDAFAALVLCDTAAKIGTDESWDARIAEIEKGGVEAIADAILQRWFTTDFRTRRSDELAGWRVMLTRTPKQGYLAACGALKRADLRPYAGAIAVQTLCLVGDEDGSTPVAMVEETAGLIKGSRFEVIRGAGHLPNLEQPETLARLIAQHAERTPSSRAKPGRRRSEEGAAVPAKGEGTGPSSATPEGV